MNRWVRFACVRWPLYLASLGIQLAWDISVACGAWWAMVQQHEAGWRLRAKKRTP